MQFRLKFHAHCGMTTIDEDLDREAARSMAAAILRRRRASGHRCTVLESGVSWEVGEPEDCMMVPDTAGILYLTEPLDVDEDVWDDDDWDEDDDTLYGGDEERDDEF